MIVTAVAGLSLIGLFAVFFVVAEPELLWPEAAEVAEATLHAAYPADKAFFETAYEFEGKNLGLSGQRVVAGIIPHHLLAADLIADFFRNLEGEAVDAVVLLGPNHFSAGQSDLITSAYDWQTPYGVLSHDAELLTGLQGIGAVAEEAVMHGEHAITSEVAFIKRTFPRATFLPVILKPGVEEQAATALAEALFKISQNKKILVLASVDFSHYKTSPEAQRDDQRSIAAIRSFDFRGVYQIEADSPPSIYTLLKFSQLNRARFSLLANTNSALLAGKPGLLSTTSYVTGFFVQGNAKLLFVGDVMLDRNVKTLVDGKGLAYIFGDLVKQRFFDGYDLVGANLEGAVTNGGEHYQPVKEFDFAFRPETVADLKGYGFTFFNLANNHFDDQGTRGMEETRKNLRDLGFDFSGCQNGVVADCSATTVAIGGKKVGLVGLSLVGAKLDVKKAEAVVSALKGSVDWVIVSIHWGEEYDQYVNTAQQNLAHALIDRGADAIVGHHPHVVQGVEVYKNKPIFYSLGNFIFDQYFSVETQQGLAVSLEFSDDGVAYALQPFKAVAGRITLLAGQEKQDFLDELMKRPDPQ